jgi:histidine triad (HIT) family protein
MDCIFCKIINKEIPAKILYEDEFTLAFYDISPKAPTHFLVIPKLHISSLDHISSENSFVLSKVFETITKQAQELNLENGYRVVSNCGADAGQTVEHIHFHILAGRELAWPPG